MPLFLCGRSALECLEARGAPPPIPTRGEARSILRGLNDVAPRLGADARRELVSLGVGSPCVELLVSKAENRRRPPGTRCFLWGGELPRGSIRRLSENVYACSAELCFVMAARELSLLALMRLAHEICGTFTPDDAAPGGLRERMPLASTSSIQAFLDEIGPVPGSVPARRAIRQTLDLSASPMESALAMHFNVMCGLGAYGFPSPTLNERIRLDEVARREYGRAFCRGDVCWGAKRVDVEYDSDLAHTGSARIASDARRRNALAHMGFTVITVTKEQLFSEREMDRVARIVAEKLHWRMRKRSYDDWQLRRRAFREEVLFGKAYLAPQNPGEMTRRRLGIAPTMTPNDVDAP